MKIEVDRNRDILLKEVFNGVGLETADREFIGVCMRDTGFECTYMANGKTTHFSLQGGKLEITGIENMPVSEAKLNDLRGND